MNIPATWGAALTRANLGSQAGIERFIRRTTSVAPSALPSDDFIATLEALLVYALVRSKHHSSDIFTLERITGVNGGALSFIAASAQAKGLVTIERGDSLQFRRAGSGLSPSERKAITLTNLGRALVDKAHAQA